jgi:hypothetical protein
MHCPENSKHNVSTLQFTKRPLQVSQTFENATTFGQQKIFNSLCIDLIEIIDVVCVRSNAAATAGTVSSSIVVAGGIGGTEKSQSSTNPKTVATVWSLVHTALYTTSAVSTNTCKLMTVYERLSHSVNQHTFEGTSAPQLR